MSVHKKARQCIKKMPVGHPTELQLLTLKRVCSKEKYYKLKYCQFNRASIKTNSQTDTNSMTNF